MQYNNNFTMFYNIFYFEDITFIEALTSMGSSKDASQQIQSYKMTNLISCSGLPTHFYLIDLN